MNSLYVETTLLVESLLKTKKRREIAIAKIQSADSTMSVHAIKEFKSGPLHNWIWLLNKLRSTRSMRDTHSAIGRNLMRPYRVGSALEAIQASSEKLLPSDYRKAKTSAELDRISADAHALALRRIITKGWANRRNLVEHVVGEVPCFLESAPYFDDSTGIMENPGRSCMAGEECGYSAKYIGKPNSLKKLSDVLKDQSRNEDKRRRDSIRALIRTPDRPFRDQECKKMGDAHFALTCPGGHCVLTSNARDHELLCGALGICVEVYLPPK